MEIFFLLRYSIPCIFVVIREFENDFDSMILCIDPLLLSLLLLLQLLLLLYYY